DLDAITPLRALTPRLDEGAVVVVVRGVLDLVRRSALHGQLDAAFALMSIPDSIVETELHLLLDVAWKVVGRHPARMDVKSRLAAVAVPVNHLQLHGVPRRPVCGPDQA